MRVSFRWPRGALATKLDRTRVGYVARVPAGTRAGTVSVTVSDRAGRRSNARRITVTAPPRVNAPTPAPGTLPGGVPGQRHVDLGAEPLRGRRPGRDRRPRPLRRDLHGLRQELGRRDQPLGAVQPGARRRAARQRPARLRVAVRLRQRPARRGQPRRRRDRRRRRLPRGRRRERSTRASTPPRSSTSAALRATVGPERTRSGSPRSRTSDYHPRLPYSVFLGPGAAQANLPQVYWKDIGGTVDAVSGHTLAHNRIYGVAIAPLGQTYDNPPPEDIARFRSLWAAYGSAGLSWWSWQATGEDEWAALAAAARRRPPSRRPTPAGRRWPRATRATRSCGCNSTSRPSTRM